MRSLETFGNWDAVGFYAQEINLSSHRKCRGHNLLHKILLMLISYQHLRHLLCFYWQLPFPQTKEYSLFVLHVICRQYCLCDNLLQICFFRLALSVRWKTSRAKIDELIRGLKNFHFRDINKK